MNLQASLCISTKAATSWVCRWESNKSSERSYWSVGGEMRVIWVYDRIIRNQRTEHQGPKQPQEKSLEIGEQKSESEKLESTCMFLISEATERRKRGQFCSVFPNEKNECYQMDDAKTGWKWATKGKEMATEEGCLMFGWQVEEPFRGHFVCFSWLTSRSDEVGFGSREHHGVAQELENTGVSRGPNFKSSGKRKQGIRFW